MDNNTVTSLSGTMVSIADILSLMNTESNVVYVICILLVLLFVVRKVKASSCTYPGGRLRLIFRKVQEQAVEVEEKEEEHPTRP